MLTLLQNSLIAHVQSICSTSTMYFVFTVIEKKRTYTLSIEQVQYKL